jgi:cysteine desulfurase
MEVYLDNSATTRTFPEVAELMTKIMCEDYGNPSSLHMKGVSLIPNIIFVRAVATEVIFTDSAA